MSTSAVQALAQAHNSEPQVLNPEIDQDFISIYIPKYYMLFLKYILTYILDPKTLNPKTLKSKLFHLGLPKPEALPSLEGYTRV